jgi:SSS family solute:Na+ symporter
LHFRTLDIVILVAYLLGTTLLGCSFFRRAQTSDRFMSAGRGLPAWALGLSIFGSFVSALSFLGLPGDAFAGDWNKFVFSLTLPFAAVVAVRYFVPFYRQAGEISSYHHLEHRFGPWARTYAVACWILMQLGRTGANMYLIATAAQPLLNWNLKLLIVFLGVLMTVLPLLGGTEGVIWAGVVQSIVFAVGTVAVLINLIIGTPGGIGQVLHTAAEYHKFSLGDWHANFAKPSVLVVFLYGLCINLSNFGIDQGYVQRYITAKSDRAAGRSVWIGALMYIPISACFLFIGTALFAFYHVHAGLLPANLKPSDVFPHFICNELPVGLTGLVIAAIFAAATDSPFSNISTLVLCDIHKRYFQPDASERQSMRVLWISTAACGVISTIAALAMIRAKSALDIWWQIQGAAAGGMLGLFLLGRISRRAGNAAAMPAAIVGVCLVVWITFSSYLPSALRSPLHEFMSIVVGTAAILGVGLGLALVCRSPTNRARYATAATQSPSESEPD